MAVVAWQGIMQGADPRSPIGVPIAATTVNSTNPNNFPVYVTVASSVSPATITNVSVNNVTVGALAGTYLVPANGTIKSTFATGSITYVTFGTGLAVANNYPFTDAMFQNFTAQQYLTVTGVSPSQTYSLEAPVEEPAAKDSKPEPVKNKE